MFQTDLQGLNILCFFSGVVNVSGFTKCTNIQVKKNHSTMVGIDDDISCERYFMVDFVKKKGRSLLPGITPRGRYRATIAL